MNHVGLVNRMNMKNIEIESDNLKAKMEQKDIENKIKIVQSEINKYKTMIELNMFSENLIDFKLKLAREEINLQDLKQKYAEYFI